IKQVAALAGRSASARERAGLFVVEGPQGVRELVRHRPDLVRDVYVTDGAAHAWPEIVSEALAADLFVHPMTDDVSQAMSGDSQGVLATARMWDVARLEVPAGVSLVAVLADARDPGNAGTVIRAADAAGA